MRGSIFHYLEDPHHDGILGRLVRPLEPTVGDGEDDRVDGIARSRRPLIEHIEFQDFQCGGEGRTRGEGRDIVALDNIKERGEVDGRVGEEPLGAGRVEDE